MSITENKNGFAACSVVTCTDGDGINIFVLPGYGHPITSWIPCFAGRVPGGGHRLGCCDVLTSGRGRRSSEASGVSWTALCLELCLLDCPQSARRSASVTHFICSDSISGAHQGVLLTRKYPGLDLDRTVSTLGETFPFQQEAFPRGRSGALAEAPLTLLFRKGVRSPFPGSLSACLFAVSISV